LAFDDKNRRLFAFRPRPFWLVALGCGAWLIGCLPLTSHASAPTESAAHADGALENSIDHLRQQDQRVAAIAYRLVTANAPLCSTTTPTLGWTLHDLAQYGQRVRDAMKQTLGLGAYPRVLALAPDGPAARAGVEVDDEVLAVNGRSLAETAAQAASYTPLQTALDIIGEALTQGPAQFTLRRNSEPLTVEIRPSPACPFDAQVMLSSTVDASADGRHVFITSALIDDTASNDDLAVVLGHEFAHDVLGHAKRLEKGGLLNSMGLNIPAVRRAEREADYVGLYLTVRAGYDISGAGDFWRRAAYREGPMGYLTFTHPNPLERAARADETVREIHGKQARTEPLIPQGNWPEPKP
jgi:hypothetical protein